MAKEFLSGMTEKAYKSYIRSCRERRMAADAARRSGAVPSGSNEREVKPMKTKAPDVEIVERTLAVVKAEGCDFREAMRKVMQENPELDAAYRRQIGV